MSGWRETFYSILLQPDDVKIVRCHYGCCEYHQPHPTYLITNWYHNSSNDEERIPEINKIYRAPGMPIPQPPTVVDLKINQCDCVKPPPSKKPRLN